MRYFANKERSWKQIQAEIEAKAHAEYEEKWCTIDDTFEEHCKMLGEGGHTPWFFCTSEGRSFSDRKEVPWEEIMKRSGEYRREMLVRHPERCKKIEREGILEPYGGTLKPQFRMTPPVWEHEFYRRK